MTPLFNAVCFAWPATTLAVKHDASRLMARTISTMKSSVKRWLGSKPRHSGTGRDADELAGTTKDKISRKICSSRMMLNCDTIRFAVIDDTRSANPDSQRLHHQRRQCDQQRLVEGGRWNGRFQSGHTVTIGVCDDLNPSAIGWKSRDTHCA